MLQLRLNSGSEQSDDSMFKLKGVRVFCRDACASVHSIELQVKSTQLKLCRVWCSRATREGMRTAIASASISTINSVLKILYYFTVLHNIAY